MKANLKDRTYGGTCPLPDKNEVSLGRHEENDVVVPFGICRHQYADCPEVKEVVLSVSRRHAAILCDASGEKYSVVDLGSKCGTYLNGTHVSQSERLPIKNGDILKLGRYELTFGVE